MNMDAIQALKGKTTSLSEFLKLEEEHCQLINGKVIMTPAPTTDHQKIIRELDRIFMKKVPDAELLFAPVDVFINEHNVFQPDLLYVAEERKEIISKRGIEGAPDLVIEILSPSTMLNDRYNKSAVYFEHGVKELWLVDPNNKTLEVHIELPSAAKPPFLLLTDSGIVKSTVLPKLNFELADIFKILT